MLVVVVCVNDVDVLEDDEDEECGVAELVAFVSNPLLLLSMMAAAIPFGLKWMAGLLASSCFRRSSSSARDGNLKGIVIAAGSMLAVSLSLSFMMLTAGDC